MTTKEQAELMWGLGLSDAEATVIRSAIGPEVRLVVWPLGGGPEDVDFYQEPPTIIWVRNGAMEALDAAASDRIRGLEGAHHVLLVDKNVSDQEYDGYLEQGYFGVLRRPLRRSKLRDLLRKSVEIRCLYADIFAMTKEIFLERELLARKTEQLIFLNRILTRASETLDVGTVLLRAREDMDMLLPVCGLQAAFWRPGASESVEADLYLCPESTAAERSVWVEFLLENVAHMAGQPIGGYNVDLLPAREDGQKQPLPAPAPGRTVLLPLKTGSETFGCLALSGMERMRLAKDQIETVHAAVSHLALALNNALLFREMKAQADFDGLTLIHNRRSFDDRLKEELKRQQRHGREVTLLLLDLDHFKQINDKMGHQAGDMVLREIGKILAQTVRASDFAARFGGEEFAVLLPETAESKAWILADRLRRKIARHRFEYLGRHVRVTASLGVASLSPGVLTSTEELVRQADAALYRAKSAGRNAVCLASERRAAVCTK